MRKSFGKAVRNRSVRVYALILLWSCLMGTACARNPHRMGDINHKIESSGLIPDFLALPADSSRTEYWEIFLDRILEKPSPDEATSELYWRAYLDSEELPAWFALIPLAVSQGNHRYSDGYSAGLWGLTEMTAGRYGLYIADNYDERLDPEKSTLAASAYWKRLRQRYASEAETLMAFVNTPLLYNNLRREYSFRADNPLWEGFGLKEWLRPEFPVQMVRAAYWYAESLNRPVPPRPARDEKTLRLKDDIPVDSVCRILSLPKDRFLELNPAVGEGKILPAGAGIQGWDGCSHDSVEYELRQSARQWKAAVTASLEKARQQAASPRSYTIRQGDSLSMIARRFHVSVSELKRWNQLKSDRIVAGKTLKIYTK